MRRNSSRYEGSFDTRSIAVATLRCVGNRAFGDGCTPLLVAIETIRPNYWKIRAAAAINGYRGRRLYRVTPAQPETLLYSCAKRMKGTARCKAWLQ